jgi:membrane protein implicated in regulation of membrane protease activity
MNKFLVAMGVYVVLGALAWATLSDPKFKFATLAILAMFAIKTWASNKRLENEQREHRDE